MVKEMEKEKNIEDIEIAEEFLKVIFIMEKNMEKVKYIVKIVKIHLKENI